MRRAAGAGALALMWSFDEGQLGPEPLATDEISLASSLGLHPTSHGTRASASDLDWHAFGFDAFHHHRHDGAPNGAASSMPHPTASSTIDGSASIDELGLQARRNEEPPRSLGDKEHALVSASWNTAQSRDATLDSGEDDEDDDDDDDGYDDLELDDDRFNGDVRRSYGAMDDDDDDDDEDDAMDAADSNDEDDDDDDDDDEDDDDDDDDSSGSSGSEDDSDEDDDEEDESQQHDGDGDGTYADGDGVHEHAASASASTSASAHDAVSRARDGPQVSDKTQPSARPARSASTGAHSKRRGARSSSSATATTTTTTSSSASSQHRHRSKQQSRRKSDDPADIQEKKQLVTKIIEDQFEIEIKYKKDELAQIEDCISLVRAYMQRLRSIPLSSTWCTTSNHDDGGDEYSLCVWWEIVHTCSLSERLARIGIDRIDLNDSQAEADRVVCAYRWAIPSVRCPYLAIP